MNRLERLIPNGIPKYVRCYDNGGETADRYTVVFTGNYARRNGCTYFGMSGNPFHPQGIGQHGWSKDIIDRPTYSHLGKKIKFEALTEKCKEYIIERYKEIWRL